MTPSIRGILQYNDPAADPNGHDEWDGSEMDGEEWDEAEAEDHEWDGSSRGSENFFSARFGEADSKKAAILAVLLAVLIASTSIYALAIRDDDEDEIVIIGFDWERAYGDGLILVANGPRLAGTRAEYEGAEYIASQFEAANLSDVHIENFTVTLYEVNSASLNLRAYSNEKGFEDKDYHHTTKFVVLGYSGSTSGTDSFDVVFVGNGTDEAYAQAGDVTGSAVLVRTDGTLSYTQLYMQAMNHSAGANIIYGDRKMPISKTSALRDEVNGGAKPITDEYGENELIPHMMVSMGAGEEIRSWNENSTGALEYCELNINFDVTIEDRITKVVVGDIPGRGGTDEFLVMGAHHDTVYCGEGGADNTAGTAGIIETARQLAQYRPKRTIRMMTFGGEEEGLFGSKIYVLEHAQEIEDNCIFMTNFDMTDLNVTDDGRFNNLPMNANSERRQKEIRKVGNEFFRQNPELDAKYNFSIGTMENYPYSDFFHFGDHGADFAACWGQNAPGYHTPSDVLENTNPESWQIAGRIMGSYTLWLANQ
jgi:hypothetical protein